MDFYRIDETSSKLGITDDEVKQLVKDGKLREFRDAGRTSYKVSEVDALSSEGVSVGEVLERQAAALTAIGIVGKITEDLPDDKLVIQNVEFWGRSERNGGGFAVAWIKKGVGFGELSVCRQKDGQLHCDAEGMSRSFVEEVFDVLLQKLVIE